MRDPMLRVGVAHGVGRDLLLLLGRVPFRSSARDGFECKDLLKLVRFLVMKSGLKGGKYSNQGRKYRAVREVVRLGS
jgi:hypothetical protein